MLESLRNSSVSVAVVSLCMLIATARVLWSDATIPQGFDEPCHIAAGMKWLDKHDYSLDSVHPPLSRDAIALPLYVAGSRLPEIKRENLLINGYCTILGNAILNAGGHYTRNLLLARIGILPFMWAILILAYLWTRQEFGPVAGYLSIALLSTVPGLLAFSSLAYTDLPTACAQFACLYAFYMWLKNPSVRRALILGMAAGIALSSKLTSGPFLAVACSAMLILWCSSSPDRTKAIREAAVPHFAMALGISIIVFWGFYDFSTGHIQDALRIDSLKPAALSGAGGSIAQRLLHNDPVIPAPDLVRGVRLIVSMNKAAPECYLLGRSKPGGWWYFFPVALGMKTPIPLMVLALIGCLIPIVRRDINRQEALTPALAILAIFFLTSFVSVRVGTRHVLVVEPLLAVLAGSGGALLWKSRGSSLIVGRVVLILLLLWQLVATVRAQGDFVGYFNEFAPSDASMALIKGCDLDCGQDLFRLTRKLRSLHASHVNVGVWSSTDLANLDLPPFEVLQPYTPVSGWVAVSVRALRTGQVVMCDRGQIFPTAPNPPDMLSWLKAYTPVAQIGKTILLYNIPDGQLQNVDSIHTERRTEHD